MVIPTTVPNCILRPWREGDQAALEEVAPLIYAELRKIAASHLRAERSDHTFSPTDLISEAYQSEVSHV